VKTKDAGSSWKKLKLVEPFSGTMGSQAAHMRHEMPKNKMEKFEHASLVDPRSRSKLRLRTLHELLHRVEAGLIFCHQLSCHSDHGHPAIVDLTVAHLQAEVAEAGGITEAAWGVAFGLPCGR